MQSQSLPALAVALILLTTAVATATTFESAAIPQDKLPVETDSLPFDADHATPTPASTPASSPTLSSRFLVSAAASRTPKVKTLAPRDMGLLSFTGKIICSGMNQQSWDDVDIACQREDYFTGYSIVFFRRDDSYFLECGCLQGLESYFLTFNAGWGITSSDKLVKCYARKGSGHISKCSLSATSRLKTIECFNNLKRDTRPSRK